MMSLTAVNDALMKYKCEMALLMRKGKGDADAIRLSKLHDAVCALEDLRGALQALEK